ncbi:Sugar-specific transcriptional regulator TrmB [Achromobacter sp. 2789STDY5608633]|uniref:helix-turn-helix domain-containing protein n=1 Tax=Achromobacter sp. 2789STDY5608633 TaxID=1806501 RepID=UPI0006C673A8|nr:helix-turn-helix domain-containing protein [Achromobacter sp. 2789STDY5608633]CUJ66499.1 Sugar-specific transcriptional regulator TrmB [Achromobacter sp. 2789STDY5608633]
MKFAGHDRHGVAIVNCLRLYGPHTIREVAELIGIDQHRADSTMRRLMCKGYVEPTGERKGVGSGRAAIYRWVDVEEAEEHGPMMNVYERKRAIAMADELVNSLRAGWNPNSVDPFRVLRVQVGGVA